MAAAAGAAESGCAPARQPYPTAFPASGSNTELKGFFFFLTLAEHVTILKEDK